MAPLETVLAFMEGINECDADKLAESMTEDHTFIDGLSQVVRGREKMRAGWKRDDFCQWERGGSIREAGDTIARDGKLLPENKWRTPAAWRAICE